MHRTLKAFPWYPNGYTREELAIGAERDFGSCTDGLVAAKMIEPVTVAAPKPIEPVAKTKKKTE